MPRLIAPYARIQIGKHQFETGDGFLQSVYVEVSETDRASNCGFTIYDPGLKLAAEFYQMSFEQGGIQVDSDLLKPNPEVENTLGSYRPIVKGSSADSSQAPEARAWLDLIRYCEGTDSPDGYRTIVGYKFFQGYAQHPGVANPHLYLETGIPKGSDASGAYQFLSTTWTAIANKLGLKDFSPANQDKAAIENIAQQGALQDVLAGEAGFYRVLPKISGQWDSLPPRGGHPKASQQALFEIYRQNLAKYKGGASSGSTSPTPQQQSNVTPTALMNAEDKKIAEASQKGTEIIIELGYGGGSDGVLSDGALIAFHYIHTATDVSGRSPDTTSFQGQCVRWLMTRRRKNTAYQNITLRQLATKVAAAYGLKLEMDGDGPTYSFLSQDGISDYQLLLREARAIGYGISDNQATLILKPLRPNFTGFVITRDMLVDKGALKFTDKATTDRVLLSALTPNQPTANISDPKAAKDRGTGQNTQTQKEDTSAAGKTGVLVTGGTTPLLHGTPAGQSAKAPVNEKVGAQTPTIASSGSTTSTVESAPDPIALIKAGQVLPSSATALPNQQIGSIALGTDGRAEAQRLASEQKRVKGYESTARLIMSPESLTLAPGSIIAISEQVVPFPFAREWRVSTARHSIQAGRSLTELHFYSPQVANVTNLDDVQTTQIDNSPSAATPGGWQWPLKGSTVAAGEFGNNRGDHIHAGIDIGGYGDDTVHAASNGRVIQLKDDTLYGEGRALYIKRSDGWIHRYFHLAKILVQPGAEVQRGQVIAIRGGSGFGSESGYAPHLHFEVHTPSGGAVNPRGVCPDDSTAPTKA